MPSLPTLFNASCLQVERRGSRVLDCVSLSIQPGEWFDLSGPSGCGKSTLLQSIARLLPITGGQMYLQGAAAQEVSPMKWRSQLVYVSQHPTAISGSVRENLLLPFTFRVFKDKIPPSDEQLLDELKFLSLENINLDNCASELSGGQLARIAFLRAALLNPKLLLLDEPDAMLDAKASQALTNYLRKLTNIGTAVVRVSHRPGEGADKQISLEDLREHSTN